MPTPLVSVVCLTYNHAAYVRNTLDGFVMQDAPFLYEVIVHDDASTDGTQDIIREYADKYPQRFTTFIETENQYSQGKDFLSDIYARCRGKYYALCEGDDFWIDPHKLRIQVEYMEENPGCMMTLHDALVFHHKTRVFYPYSLGGKSHALSPAEIIGNGFATASMVFRPEALPPKNSFYLEAGIGDWTLRLCALEQAGEIYYFDRVMSLYRAWTPNSYCQRTYGDFVPALKHVWELIQLMRRYNVATGSKYEKYLVARVQQSVRQLFGIAQAKDSREFKALLAECDSNFLEQHERYINELKRLFSQIYQEDVSLDASVRRSVQGFRHVVIYGAGHLGQKIAGQMKREGLSFDGFVVSSGRKHPHEMLGKEVWAMDELPFSNSEVLVIVAIDAGSWDMLADQLDMSGITHVLCPLLYDMQKS